MDLGQESHGFLGSDPHGLAWVSAQPDYSSQDPSTLPRVFPPDEAKTGDRPGLDEWAWVAKERKKTSRNGLKVLLVERQIAQDHGQMPANHRDGVAFGLGDEASDVVEEGERFLPRDTFQRVGGVPSNSIVVVTERFQEFIEHGRMAQNKIGDVGSHAVRVQAADSQPLDDVRLVSAPASSRRARLSWRRSGCPRWNSLLSWRYRPGWTGLYLARWIRLVRPNGLADPVVYHDRAIAALNIRRRTLSRRGGMAPRPYSSLSGPATSRVHCGKGLRSFSAG